MSSERFRKGDRVVSTAAAVRAGIWDGSPLRPPVYGTVVQTQSVRTQGRSVHVLPDGSVSPHRYHVDFWTRAEGV